MQTGAAFFCLFLGYYLSAAHYALIVWFQIAIGNCSRSQGGRGNCALVTGPLVPFPFTAGQEPSSPLLLDPGLCAFPFCLPRVLFPAVQLPQVGRSLESLGDRLTRVGVAQCLGPQRPS